jgi:hypothetical protein
MAFCVHEWGWAFGCGDRSWVVGNHRKPHMAVSGSNSEEQDPREQGGGARARALGRNQVEIEEEADPGIEKRAAKAAPHTARRLEHTPATAPRRYGRWMAGRREVGIAIRGKVSDQEFLT